jgi:3-oxoacyl-[acyl-carrier-protein] synthase II
MERVVISGIGVVSPIGSNLQEFNEGLISGRKGISEISSFNAEYYPTKLCAEVGGVTLGPGIDKKEIFLEKAISELLSNNDVFEKYPPENRILSIGSGVDYLDLKGFVNCGDFKNWIEHTRNCYDLANNISNKRKINGGTHVNVSACVASNQAIGLGYRILTKKKGKVIIAGGVDSMIDPLGYIGFYKLGALSNWAGNPESSSRPFDKNRCGVVLGEGAAVFQMQNIDETDPDKIQAEIIGYGSSIDAYLITDPQPDGSILAQAAINAIQEAGITENDIDCVHLHGTATPKNGIAEANAMRIIFGERYSDIPVFGLKGQVGHIIGACGVVELVAAVFSLKNQVILPTVNFEDPDPEVPLRVITGQPLEMKITYLLKLNSAFGGQNSAIVLKKVSS